LPALTELVWGLPTDGGRSRPAGESLGGSLGAQPSAGSVLRVEEINRTIISLLARDGRMSFTELAKRTGLSVSAAQQRVRRLEQRGVIKGYAAVIDPEDAGLPLTAFVSIKPFDPAAPDDAPQRLAHLTAIEACHSVAGEENYILKVRVATPADLEDLLQEIRTAASVSTRTTVVLSTPYENRPPHV
jgi:Lrp/AsnC family transcriptional regulator, leucine-responsive regulatory protein